MLHTHVYSPESPTGPVVLAIHGLTGRGARWASLAAGPLAHRRVVAPDLLGHGRSPWEPPWGIDDNVAALSDVIDALIPTTDRPIVIVGHSYGGAIAVRLAAHRPADVAGLVLLDPAQGLDPATALRLATDSVADPGYADAAEAKAAKRSEGWAEVADEHLDTEIAEHLIPTDDGRVGWRVCTPATAVAWSDMAREAVLPPAGIPTTVVVADHVDPPFVRSPFLDACARLRPDTVRIVRADCGHMVPFARPALTADLVDAAVWTVGS